MATVLYNKKILPFYYKLGMGWKNFPRIEPGQFVMLRISHQVDPLLRRPFGVYKIFGQGVTSKKQGIEIIYKVVGKGTKMMTGLKPHDTVDILGPLGNGFPLITPPTGRGLLTAEEDESQFPFARLHPRPQDGAYGGLWQLKIRSQEIIMVAGGIGIVPFYLLAKSYQRSAISLKLLFGGRGKEDLPGLNDFKRLGIDISISTDDGSVGKKGLVTELLKSEIQNQKSKIIYACGSKGMLKEVAGIAEKADAPCYISLDNAMACGIGACLGCAVKVQGQGARGKGQEKQTSKLSTRAAQLYKMVCSDGPVFDAREIEWEEI